MEKLHTADRRTFKISKLREPEYNPNEMTQAEMDRLEASMEKFGVVEPPVVNIRHGRTGVIVGGSHRVRIIKRRGNKEVDCVFVDLSLADEKELNLRLNKHRGTPVAEILQEFFEPDELLVVGFNDLDLAGFGMLADDAAEELLSAATPDELPADLAIAKLREIVEVMGVTTANKALEALQPGGPPLEGFPAGAGGDASFPSGEDPLDAPPENRQFQVFLMGAQYVELYGLLDRFKKHFGTANQSDTLIAALRAAAEVLSEE